MTDENHNVLPFRKREPAHPVVRQKWEELRKTYQGPAQYPAHILGLDGDD